MGKLRCLRKEKSGVLSIIDGVIFAVLILLASMFLLHSFGGALSGEKDLRSTESRKEMVEDVQSTSLVTTIEKTGFTNESGDEDSIVEIENITVERALKEYLYLDNERTVNEDIRYDLSRLEDDIKYIYNICARDIGHYHFAVESSFQDGRFFISDVPDIGSADDLPAERGASTSTTVIGDETVNVTLYIWR